MTREDLIRQLRKYCEEGNALMALATVRLMDDLGMERTGMLRQTLRHYFANEGKDSSSLSLKMYYLPKILYAPASIHSTPASATAYRVKKSPFPGRGDMIADMEEYEVDVPFLTLQKIVGGGA